VGTKSGNKFSIEGNKYQYLPLFACNLESSDTKKGLD